MEATGLQATDHTPTAPMAAAAAILRRIAPAAITATPDPPADLTAAEAITARVAEGSTADTAKPK